MMTTRRLFVAFGAALGLVALTACGPSAPGATGAAFTTELSGVVNAWGFDNADEVGTSRLDLVSDTLADSDVTVELDATPFDAQKFTTLAASGRVPDVVQMDRQFVTTYAAKGLIRPLDECYSANDVNAKERYYPSVVADVTYQDQIWGVPQFYQPPAIMLNNRVLAEAGITADQIDIAKPDQLLAAITAMTVLDNGIPTRLGFDAQPTSQASTWMLAFGGSLIDDEGKPALDDPNNVKAIEFLAKVTDAQGGWANVKSFTDSFDFFGDNNQFVADQVGAEIVAQWFVNVLAPYTASVDITAVPIRDTGGNAFAVAGGTAFVIPTNADNPAAACRWALDLTSEEAWEAAGAARAATIAETPGSLNTGLFTGSPAADQSLREQYTTGTGNAGFDAAIATYYDVVGEGKSFGSSPAGQQIQSELVNAVNSALLGEKTPEKALEEAQAAAMRAYEQSGAQ